VEVPYASSGATGEAFQTGLDRGHNAEMELISPPFSGDSHFLSYPLHFHCLYIHYLIFIPNNITFPIHPLVISRPTFHLTLLSFHWSNISLSSSLTPLFPVYQFPTGTFILKSLFHLSPFICSAIHSTSICVSTHKQPFYIPILFLQLLLPEHAPISLLCSLSCHMHLSSLHVPFLSTLMIEAVDPLSHHYTPTNLHDAAQQTVILSINAM